MEAHINEENAINIDIPKQTVNLFSNVRLPLGEVGPINFNNAKVRCNSLSIVPVSFSLVTGERVGLNVSCHTEPFPFVIK